MMALNIKSLALLAWVVVNATLVLSIGAELGWGGKWVQTLPAPVVHPSAPVEIAFLPDFRLPAREKAYAQSLVRPLFVPSRRKAPPVPVAPPPPPPPPPTMQKGQFQLLGTIITDKMKIAVIKEISSGKERQVVQGFNINGLQLDLVEPDRILFSQYGDQEEIRLRIQRSARPVAAPQGGQGARLLVQPSGRVNAQGVPGGRVERPVPAIPPPQTMEERARDPLLKDFYK